MARPEFPNEPIRVRPPQEVQPGDLPAPPPPIREADVPAGQELCPACGGARGSVAFVCMIPRSQSRQMWMACPFCTAEGKVEAARAIAYVEGRRRRDDRVARGLSQREEAERLGITQRELRDIEQGARA
jgi:hypothetical protein